MSSELSSHPVAQRFCKDPEGFHDVPEPLPLGEAWFADNGNPTLYPSPVCKSCAGFLMGQSEWEEYMESDGDPDPDSCVTYRPERMPRADPA